MINGIDHIGIAVENLDESIALFESLFGLECQGVDDLQNQNARIATFKTGEVRIELLEANCEDSPIAKYIKRRGTGLHHIAFGTDDIDRQINEAKSKGARMTAEKPIVGVNGKLISFYSLESTNGILIELCQSILKNR